MELAAARSMMPRLRDGESTVAIDTDLRHLAHTGEGTLRVEANEQGTSGRLHRFTVNVFDANGLVASGAHTRAIVSNLRLLGLARRRAGKPSMQLDV